MKKNNLVISCLYVAWGIVNLLAGLLTNTKLDDIFFGMAGAGIVPGIMMIYRYFYWKSPKNSRRYQEILENEQIEQRDELKEKVRGLAARYTYLSGVLMTSFAMLVFAVLGSLDVPVDYRVTVLYLGGFLIFQGVAGVVMFKRLMKKYE